MKLSFKGSKHELVEYLIRQNKANDVLDLLADQLLTENKHGHLFTLYLGINRKLEQDPALKDKIVALVSHFSDSFTFGNATGFFQGIEEETILVQLAVTNKIIAYRCAEKLRQEFQQVGVGIVETGEYKRVIVNNKIH